MAMAMAMGHGPWAIHGHGPWPMAMANDHGHGHGHGPCNIIPLEDATSMLNHLDWDSDPDLQRNLIQVLTSVAILAQGVSILAQ